MESIGAFVAVGMALAFPAYFVWRDRDSYEVCPRRRYAITLAVCLFAPGVVAVLTVLLVGDSESASVFIELFGLLWIFIAIPWLFTMVSQRARDAGASRALAYWCIAPLIGSLLLLYLLFPASTSESSVEGLKRQPANT